jgi:site-specific recombinase XerD
VQAWLSLQESETTRRAYRKEAERLLLWAIVERGRALSSLMTEDAIAYRAFLRRPHPHARWIGPVRSRSSHDWRPFQSALSPRSVAYALTVIGALFRWLVEHHYLLANPFAGLKVKGAGRSGALDAKRAFTEPEWRLIRECADKAESQFGWSESAAQRMRFALDFAFATGLRSNELVGASLKQIEWDAQGDAWIHVVGKGSKAGQVALPPVATAALDRYLMERGLPVTRTRWNPKTPLLPSLDEDGDGITSSRLWKVMKGFFTQVAKTVGDDNPALVEKLLRASPHWMRHTHATHALANGVELTTVRDNLRHTSVSTTSIYLHTDQRKRAKQVAGAFGLPKR